MWKSASQSRLLIDKDHVNKTVFSTSRFPWLRTSWFSQFKTNANVSLKCATRSKSPPPSPAQSPSAKLTSTRSHRPSAYATQPLWVQTPDIHLNKSKFFTPPPPPPISKGHIAKSSGSPWYHNVKALSEDGRSLSLSTIPGYIEGFRITSPTMRFVRRTDWTNLTSANLQSSDRSELLACRSGG